MFTKFLNPRNDVAFKRIFGTERNSDILIHFINSILELSEHPIVEVTFLKPTQDVDLLTQKTSIVDVMCQDQNGSYYIVEMQVAKEKGFEKRAQYYAAKAYGSQLCVGGKYEDLKGIIFIALSDFILFKDKPDFKSDHVTLDKKSLEHDLKAFSFTFLELPKFKKTIDELDDIIDKWVYFFKIGETISPEDLEKIIEGCPIIGKAYHELDRFYWNRDELLTYEQREKYEGCYRASMRQKYEDGIEIGREEGIEIGEKKGREEGIEIGEKKGREEGIEIGEKKGREEERRKFIINLKGMLSVEEIARSQGLSIDEVEEIFK